MNSMFDGCKALADLDVSSFDTSMVTDLSSMFSYCSSLTSIDVSGFDTSQVTDMNRMFWSCTKLLSLDLDSFDTTNVTDMYGLFGCCYALTELDISGFDTSQVTDMSYMFYSCSRVSAIRVSPTWSTKAVTKSNTMFNGCTNLIGGTGFAFDSSKTDATYATTDYYLTLKETAPPASVSSINEMVRSALLQVLAA